MLARARKYKVSLTLAHQLTAQIPEKLLQEIFGNVLTFVSFSVSKPDANKLSQEYVYNYGYGLESVHPDKFINLRTGEALVKIDRTVFSMNTILLPTDPRPDKVDYIISRSQHNYGKGAKWEVNIKPFDERHPEVKLLPMKINLNDPLDHDKVF